MMDTSILATVIMELYRRADNAGVELHWTRPPRDPALPEKTAYDWPFDLAVVGKAGVQ